MAIKWKIVGINDPGKQKTNLSDGEKRWESPLMFRRSDARDTLWEIIQKIDTSEHGRFLWLFGPYNGADYAIRRVEIAREFEAWVERVDTNAGEADAS